MVGAKAESRSERNKVKEKIHCQLRNTEERSANSCYWGGGMLYLCWTPKKLLVSKPHDSFYTVEPVCQCTVLFSYTQLPIIPT